jgi:pantoate--beta-alanine ligase
VADGGLAVVRTVAELRHRIATWRAADKSLALVPTMGALHAGHLSLMRLAKRQADRTCASLFVNPRQFSPREDFSAYPREEAADVAKLRGEGVDLLFVPSAQEMYPPGSATQVSVPGLGDILEGAVRPGFFTGVATVVTKLLAQVAPDVAIFGEKDYQQLLVIRRLIADLDIPVEIIVGPTVREPDGLAMASRNAYLTALERPRATALYAAIKAVAAKAAGDNGGVAVENAIEAAAETLAAAGFARVDYIALLDAETLAGNPPANRPRRVLGAAWLGKTRLIDNVAV